MPEKVAILILLAGLIVPHIISKLMTKNNEHEKFESRKKRIHDGDL